MSDFKPGSRASSPSRPRSPSPTARAGALRYRGVDIEELVGATTSSRSGAPRRRELLAGPARGRAVRRRRPDREHACRPPGRDRPARGGVGRQEADRHLRRRGARGSARLSAQFISIAAQSARIADGTMTGSRRRRSRRARRRRSGSSSSGEARPTRSTSRRSTPTGSAPVSTASTPPPSSPGSPPRPAPTAPRRSRPRSAPSQGRCTAAPARVLPMLDAAAESGDPAEYVQSLIERGERLMGFGHRVYRAEDPRARLLKKTAKELGAPRYDVAERLEAAALEALRRSRPTVRSRQRRVLVGRRARRRRDPARASRRRCSPAPARPAGRRTSSSRRS